MNIIRRQTLATLGLLLISGLGLFVQEVSAQSNFKQGFTEVQNEATQADIKVPTDAKAFILTLVNMLLTFTAVIALIALLYAAFLMIVHMGEEKDIEKAKNIIKYAIIGLIVIGLSATIINVVVRVVLQGK